MPGKWFIFRLIMPLKLNKNDKFKLDGGNRTALTVMLGLSLLFLIFVGLSRSARSEEISYSRFLIELRAGNIENVTILDMREIRGLRFDSDGRTTGFTTIIPYFDEGLMTALAESGVMLKGDSKGMPVGAIILQALPVLVLIGVLIWMFRNAEGGGRRAAAFGRSKAKRYDASGKNITFADVAGQQEAKYELEEVVSFLKSPDRFTRLGAKIPKGVLLVGRPGTGKTLLAKAVAGEAGVPFFHMSGSDFVEMFVGVGASRVRDLFEQGRKSAPCILFIDEIDAVGRVRGAGYGGGHDEREQTLNQLLVEMDGFETDKGVIIIAATNRPDVLDPALLRPGRFDRQVTVGMPDVKERHAILTIHCSRLLLGKDVDLSRVARATPGSSGADIANIVNEAALFAGRGGRERVCMADFEEARDKILMGVARRSMVMSDEERLMTAYHEAGHALLHYVGGNTDPVHKVTIIPRGEALGVTFSLPEKDLYSRSIGRLKSQLVVLYGGYAAEELIFEETTTGAQNDIRVATDLARRMVCDWGMSSMGPIAFGGSEEPIFIGKEIAQRADYSEDTAKRIDEQIGSLLREALDTARMHMRNQREKLELLTRALMDRETLDDGEIRGLWGLGDSGVLGG